MKLKRKLIVGFIAVSLLVGIVGFLGLYANNKIVNSFERGDEHFGPIIEASGEVSSYAKRAEGHTMLFLTLHNETDKQKFFMRLASLRDQNSIMDEKVKNPEARKILDEIKSKTDELQSIGESLFKAYDYETKTTGRFAFENHEELILRLDDVASEIRSDGLKLAKIEVDMQIEQDQAAKRDAAYLYNIIFIISLFAVFGALVLGYVIAKNIADPVMKLKEKAINIGKGNRGTRIEVESKDEIGELARAFNGMAEDLQRSNDEIVSAKDYTENIVRSMTDTLIVVSPHGTIQTANPAACTLLGYKYKELIGQPIDNVLPDDESLFDGPGYDYSIKKQLVRNVEKKYLSKDRRKIPVVFSASTMHDNDGKIQGIIYVAQDITEKKKLEAQLLRAQRMESIGTLANGIAHDINNVLSPIMLSLELLQEKFTDDGSQKLIGILDRSARRGANLIKQVQSFARGIEGERKALQIIHLISEIRQIAKETFPRNIEVKTGISKDLWTTNGDATQLHQVLMNLCVNARDAMPDGGILGISAENLFIEEHFARMNIEARVGPYIVITVSDTGTGIPAEIIDRIFEPFFTTKAPGKGTGLGLSTALGIVKSHGGFITLYSEVEKGTIFKVYLPAITATEIQKAQVQQLESPAGHGECILVVDDEAQIRDVTTAILKKYGYKVLTADNGKEAIILYSKYREEIKVVLMDMMMPVMDGQTSIEELIKVNPDIKIIAVSGLTEKDKIAKIAYIHVHAFLPKPYTAERLLKTIHEVICAK